MNKNISEDDLLAAFAVEEKRDLVAWIAKYPQFAVGLCCLAHELCKPMVERELDDEDRRLIEEAWQKYKAAVLK